jgi:hypothetical protein
MSESRCGAAAESAGSLGFDQRFNLWIGRQIDAGRNFNENQMNRLRAIKDYLAANPSRIPRRDTRSSQIQ